MDRRWLGGGIKAGKSKGRTSFLHSFCSFRYFIELIEACGNSKEKTDEGKIRRSAELFIKPIAEEVAANS